MPKIALLITCLRCVCSKENRPAVDEQPGLQTGRGALLLLGRVQGGSGPSEARVVTLTQCSDLRYFFRRTRADCCVDRSQEDKFLQGKTMLQGQGVSFAISENEDVKEKLGPMPYIAQVL
eukprot:scaffold22160_cov16-Prasinocladus_malaysianus.AAC.1